MLEQLAVGGPAFQTLGKREGIATPTMNTNAGLDQVPERDPSPGMMFELAKPRNASSAR